MLIEVNINELAKKAIKYSSRKENYPDFLNQLLEESFENWDSGNLNEALNYCNQFIQLEPNVNIGLLLKSILLTSKKKFDKSDEILNSISIEELNELENEIRLFTISCNCFYTKRNKEAIGFCDELILIKPSNYTIYLIRGLANAELENHKEAILDFKMALKEKWEIKGIKSNLAYSYLRNGNRIKSLLLFRQVVNHFPDHWKIQYNTGLSYFKLGFFSKALIYLNKTEELKPDFSGTYLTRGYIYLKRGFKEKALIDWNLAKELGEEKKYKTLISRYYNKY
jgi:tetratricopeptide (TPR) repeat protein